MSKKKNVARVKFNIRINNRQNKAMVVDWWSLAVFERLIKKVSVGNRLKTKEGCLKEKWTNTIENMLRKETNRKERNNEIYDRNESVSYKRKQKTSPLIKEEFIKPLSLPELTKFDLLKYETIHLQQLSIIILPRKEIRPCL